MKFKKILAGILSAGVLMTSLPLSIPTVSAAELPEPVMKVTFDDATATDVTGRGNDGTLVGDPAFVAGVSGKAIYITNSEEVAGQSKQAEQYVDFGKPEDLQFGEGDFSLSFWYKTDPHDSVTHKEGAVVSNKNWDSGGNPGFNIGDMRQGLNLNFNIEGYSDRKETDRFAQAIDGKWHHIAATFDRDGYMTLYIDGNIYEAGNFNSNPASINISDYHGSVDVANFVLGADGNFKNSVLGVYLDEFAVYKQALTKEQVGELAKEITPPESKPVLKVTFDDETADDTSGNGLNGEIVGSPEFVEGVEGKAIHLSNPDGIAAAHTTAEQYVNFGQPEELQFGTDDFTVMFWYQADGSQPEEVSVVSNKDWNSGGNDGFNIGDMRNGMTLNFRAVGGSGRLDTGRYGGATENKWHHIAAVFNRTGDMTLYVDGVKADSTKISGQKGLSIDVADFVLGADGLHNFGVKDSYIDELMVYRTALSQEEIENYNAPYVLQNKIAEYEELAANSDASPEKVEAFQAAIADVKQKAEGVTDLDKIAELTEQLRKAYNAFIGPEDGIINFEVISDTHIPGTDKANATNQKLIDVFEDLERDYPDNSVVLHCGDFSQDGSETQVKGYFDILNDYKDEFTIMTALGNHDVRWKSGWDEIYERYMRYNQEYMGDTDGKVYFDKWINGYHFIVLNTEWDIKDRAYISPEQLEWLDQTMAENADPSKPIFIAFHQAMRDTYAISNDWSIGVQDYALKEVLRKYPQTIMFTGHIHDGLGAIEVLQTDYGVVVDVPSLKDNDQGDRRGQIGFHVTVYEDEVRIDLRDYLNNEWMPEYSYTVDLDPSTRPMGKVLEVNFDDETATDVSGNGNDGTLVGDLEFVDDGNGGKALHIVNSDAVATQAEKAEQYVDFGDKLQFGEDDFTIMFSYKGATSGSGDGCVIGNKNWDTGANPGFAIGAFAGQNPGMGLNLNTEGGSRLDTNRYDAATDGEWHEIAATFDRDGEMTLYIDGKAAGSKDISGQAGNPVDVEGLKLVLGADGNYQNSVRDMYIDNLKIYKKVLGAAELETTWDPYEVEVDSDSVTISWPLPSDDSVEPAYLALNGKKVVDIDSGATSATINNLQPNTEYTVLLVNREKAHSNNYRDVYPFVITTKEAGVDKSELAGLYNTNKNKTQGNYTDASWKVFQDALALVETTLNNEEATEAEVQAAVDAMKAALDGLTLKGDTTALQKVIDKAKSLDLNLYVDDKEAKDAFAEALNAAEALLKNTEATQPEVDEALKKLADAMTALRLRADKENLNKWLEDLKSIDLSQYTEESAAVVRAAIAKAEALAEQDLDKNEQGLVDAMVAEMESAKAQLDPAPADPGNQEDPNPGDGSGDSSAPNDSKPNDDASSQNPTGSEGKEVTDEVPTTGDSAPIAALSALVLAAAGALLLKKRRS